MSETSIVVSKEPDDLGHKGRFGVLRVTHMNKGHQGRIFRTIVDMAAEEFDVNAQIVERLHEGEDVIDVISSDEANFQSCIPLSIAAIVEANVSMLDGKRYGITWPNTSAITLLIRGLPSPAPWN